MTFSIAGRCARTGMVGMAISTSSIGVTGRCAWMRAKVGAAGSQNVTDPTLGIRLLDLMQEGTPADEAIEQVVAETPHVAYRQLTAVDMQGRTGHYTGSQALGLAAARAGRDCIAAGNLLANTEVPVAMAHTFEADSDVHLAERLLRALEEGLVAGGEAGPVHSAGLIVCHELPWAIVNLRIDWAEENPLAQLRSLWEAYEPQMKDYILRAADPTNAPSFGVPGDP